MTSCLENQIPILIVDDDEVLQRLLSDFLSAHGYYIRSLLHGSCLKKTLTNHNVELIVLDIVLPGKDGLYWLTWLKDQYPQIPVLILSAQDTAEKRIQGLECGAHDYLVKPFHPRELLIRIRNILHTSNPPTSMQISIGRHVFDPSHGVLNGEGYNIKLTTQETALLNFFCQNTDKVLSRDTISHALYGNDHRPMDRKIDMLITRLRKKLEDDHKAPQHLHTVWRKGYRFTL